MEVCKYKEFYEDALILISRQNNENCTLTIENQKLKKRLTNLRKKFKKLKKGAS